MIGNMSEREKMLAEAWRDCANDMGASPWEILRIVSGLIGSCIVRVSKTREDALAGIAALNTDLGRIVDEKFGKPS